MIIITGLLEFFFFCIFGDYKGLISIPLLVGGWGIAIIIMIIFLIKSKQQNNENGDKRNTNQ